MCVCVCETKGQPTIGQHYISLYKYTQQFIIWIQWCGPMLGKFCHQFTSLPFVVEEEEKKTLLFSSLSITSTNSLIRRLSLVCHKRSSSSISCAVPCVHFFAFHLIKCFCDGSTYFFWCEKLVSLHINWTNVFRSHFVKKIKFCKHSRGLRLRFNSFRLWHDGIIHST